MVSANPYSLSLPAEGRPEFFRWNVQSFIAVEVELPQLRELTDTLWQLGQLVPV